MKHAVQRGIVTLLSLSRLPVVAWMVFRELPASAGFSLSMGLGLGWLVLSDGLDGLLARRWQVEGVLGRVVDHVTDKVIILAFAWGLSEYRDLPRWVLGLLALREGLSSLVGLALWKVRRVMPGSRFWGRITGVVGVLGLLAYLDLWPLRQVLLWLYLGCALVASLLYGWVYGAALFRRERSPLAVS